MREARRSRRPFVTTQAVIAAMIAAGCSTSGGGGRRADGMLVAERYRSADVDGFAGFGFFPNYPLLWPPTWVESPSFPSDDDSCGLHHSEEPAFTDAEEDSAPFDDVGSEITFAGPGGTLTLYRDEMNFYGSSLEPASLFVPGGTYSIASEDGALDLELLAPPALTLTSPALGTTAGFVVIDRSVDWDITWIPGGGGEIHVAIPVVEEKFGSGEEEGGLERVTLSCRFSDDGLGTVPSDLLEGLPGDAVDADVHVYQVSYDNVNVSGAGRTYVGILDRWSRSAVLE